MKTPWMLLRDLEDLFALEQKGSITKEKYLSMKKKHYVLVISIALIVSVS